MVCLDESIDDVRYAVALYGLRGSSYLHFCTICIAIGGLELNRIPDIDPQLDKPAETACKFMQRIVFPLVEYPYQPHKRRSMDTCYAWRRITATYHLLSNEAANRVATLCGVHARMATTMGKARVWFMRPTTYR